MGEVGIKAEILSMVKSLTTIVFDLRDKIESMSSKISGIERKVESVQMELTRRFRRLETKLDLLYEEYVFSSVMKFCRRQWMLNIFDDIDPYDRLYVSSVYREEFTQLHAKLNTLKAYWDALPIKHPSLCPKQVKFNI
ncbi:hypothetical protein O9G_006384, partial [Rozella allomycis CSF55]